MTDTPHTPNESEQESRDRARSELRAAASSMTESRLDQRDAGGISIAQRSLSRDAVRAFAHNRIALLGACILVLFISLAIVVPMGGRGEQAQINNNFAQADIKPTLKCVPIPEDAKTDICRHPFGTDSNGRDMWIRAWLGARISLSIGFGVAFMILLVGVTYGTISGYFGGRVDNGMMRFLDSLYGLPYIPFAAITIGVLQQHYPDAPPIVWMVPALSLTAWFTAARIVRGQVLSLRAQEYVAAARAAGSNVFRIMRRHLIPNTLGVIIIAIFLEVPGAILGEATLSFIGLGVSPDYPTWGAMASQYKADFSHPWRMLIPAALIAMTVLSAIAIADGLRDALDPRGHEH